jgi:hypothetical protein
VSLNHKHLHPHHPPPHTHTRTHAQVELHKRQRLAPYDVALKGFKYHEALDAALAQRNPRTIVAVLEELIMRRVGVWVGVCVCCVYVVGVGSEGERGDLGRSMRSLRLLSPRQPTNHPPTHQGLRIALTGRDEAGLEPLMAFLARYVTHPDFADTLSDAAHMVLGACDEGRGGDCAYFCGLGGRRG